MACRTGKVRWQTTPIGSFNSIGRGAIAPLNRSRAASLREAGQYRSKYFVGWCLLGYATWVCCGFSCDRLLLNMYWTLKEQIIYCAKPTQSTKGVLQEGSSSCAEFGPSYNLCSDVFCTVELKHCFWRGTWPCYQQLFPGFDDLRWILCWGKSSRTTN